MFQYSFEYHAGDRQLGLMLFLRHVSLDAPDDSLEHLGLACTEWEVHVDMGRTQVHDIGLDGLGLESFDPSEPCNPFDGGDLHCREDRAISVSELQVQSVEILERFLSCPISRPGRGGEVVP